MKVDGFGQEGKPPLPGAHILDPPAFVGIAQIPQWPVSERIVLRRNSISGCLHRSNRQTLAPVCRGLHTQIQNLIIPWLRLEELGARFACRPLTSS